MLLYYIRHGDPIYKPDSLTPLGQKQAEAIAKRLAVHGIDEVYTSTSNRAILTGRPLCDILKLTPTELDWCNEKYAHRYFSTTMEDGSRNFAIARPDMKRLFVSNELFALGQNWYEHPALTGEGFREGVEFFSTRIDAFLEEHGYRRDSEEPWYIPVEPNEKRIAIFAHWGVGGAIMSHLLGIPYPRFVSSFGLSHSDVCVLEFKERNGIVVPQALTYGNDSHLYREGLPTKYENRMYI